ncbi:nickel pincer cofactor biosynthesis protein LarC [Magnetofaba australis]|uniref:nickel pincer cofactor biosynthesis protein LarC n=1 Tax=Magnetofaba australis TaxID=1472297 RepID=UPI000A19B829|nr:nickel pincer cofactor biosynthesis protein LarC [Magnetofaba australis]
MKWHLDLDAGIAGNMFLGACLDLGLDRAALESALASLNLPGWRFTVEEARRGGLRGTHLDVEHDEGHVHRHLPDIERIIDESALSDAVKTRAKDIFAILAEAEGAVHGIAAHKVHFHEVGAVDAIIDICGAAYAFEALGVADVTASKLMAGSGHVRCAHGRMPVPVPAVAQMLARHGIPLAMADSDDLGELATPTGVAILAHLRADYGVRRLERVDAIGVGLGGREVPGRANGLRILAQYAEHFTDDSMAQREEVTVLSAHIDDMNPEWYGPLWSLLPEAGALDVALLPMTMKKGRPGVRLEVVCTPDKARELAQLILTHSTTLGVREQSMTRWAAPRSGERVESPWGALGIKRFGSRVSIEHDDLARIAVQQGWPLPQAQRRVDAWLQASGVISEADS